MGRGRGLQVMEFKVVSNSHPGGRTVYARMSNGELRRLNRESAFIVLNALDGRENSLWVRFRRILWGL